MKEVIVDDEGQSMPRIEPEFLLFEISMTIVNPEETDCFSCGGCQEAETLSCSADLLVDKIFDVHEMRSEIR